MSKIEIKKNSFGYFEVDNKPSKAELANYYSTKYYQSGAASYELSYSKEEVEYFLNKIEEKVYVALGLTTLDQSSSVLDIGCGEGWVLNYFKTKQVPVTGIDYSSYGCSKFNPHCVDDLIEGDLYGNLNMLINEGKKYDLVWLDNVLEHVLDPLDLLQKAEKLLASNGVLMVEVPNDYSVLQNHLLEKGHIDREYWVAYPDHLSYFNKDGLNNLASSAGLKSVFSMGDFPIDINLLNSNTNYTKDKTKGKSCYLSKVEFENLVHKQKMDAVVNFYKSLMDLGIGRCIISYFIKK
jgi:2-polyprenyl-3-methyl-5-hydroxy-6-metoxy-1,4-benzoquinol methylase